ncbi:endo alpha-1,4 polygalactosaminidase [Deinococcus sonorensis]|uniref:Endo alpha-1,4 polygalactosaminidase n=2 Tax=Deinococcus sonorensis TaxID=309891 RepID=A0AAU7UCZ5_9DEIO
MPRPRATSLEQVRSLWVYYGAGHEAQLRGHDLLIVQAPLYGPAGVGRLRSGGALVLGYLSVGEDHRPAGSEVYHRRVNPLWGSSLVEVAHPAWQQHVQQQARYALQECGCDGLLLDTLDSGEPATTARLVQELRRTFPQALLLANRGFGLLERLRPSLNGVLFEAFSTTWENGCKAHTASGLHYTARELARVRQLGLPVLAIDYAPPGQQHGPLASFARRRAEAYGLVGCVSTRSLDSLPEPGGAYKGAS